MNAEIIRFLDDLRRNNNTVWFHENRERYDKLRCAFINEVQELIERISVFDPDIRGLDARKCLFRHPFQPRQVALQDLYVSLYCSRRTS